MCLRTLLHYFRLKNKDVTVLVTILIDYSNATVLSLLQEYMKSIEVNVIIDNSTIIRFGKKILSLTIIQPQCNFS